MKIKVLIASFIISLVIISSSAISNIPSNSDEEPSQSSLQDQDDIQAVYQHLINYFNSLPTNERRESEIAITQAIKEHYTNLEKEGKITAQEKAMYFQYLNTQFWDDFYSGDLLKINPREPRQAPMLGDVIEQPELSLDEIGYWPRMFQVRLVKPTIGPGFIGGLLALQCPFVFFATWEGCMAGCAPRCDINDLSCQEQHRQCTEYCMALAVQAFLECMSTREIEDPAP